MNPIEAYYDEIAGHEWERLDRHRIEFAITLRALREYLPPAPLAIIDIGGGPGRYAIALARRGDDVTLLDLSQSSLDLARVKADEAQVTLSGYVHGNAIDLAQFTTGSFDAALLMGPLYHLLEPSERSRAVSEAQRVLKSGGLIFATFITRTAPIRYAALNDPQWLVKERERVDSFLADGVYRAPSPGGDFTDAYFAHPADIKPLFEKVGFQSLGLLACEGIVSQIDRHLNLLSGDLWQEWVDLNYRFASDPAIHGTAEHLLYIGKKMESGS